MPRIRGGQFGATNHGIVFPLGGGGGAVIKTVQSGTATIADTTSLLDVTITAVDLTKTFVVITHAWQASGGGSDHRNLVMARLTSTTNLRLTTAQMNNGGVTVTWFVVEFLSGVTVQSGVTSFDAATSNVAITSVNTSQAFVVATHANPAAQLSGNYHGGAYLSAANQLQCYRLAGADGNSTTVAWFVVEFQ